MNEAIKDIQPTLIRKIFELKQPTSIDLSLGEPHLPLNEELWSRTLARFKSTKPGYSANLGMPSLRQKIAHYYSQTSLKPLNENQVIVTVGSQQALFLAFFSLLNPGDEVIIPDPAYAAYAPMVTMQRAHIKTIPLSAHNNYHLSIEAIQASITPRTKLVIVSSPGNPLGQIDDQEFLQSLAQLAEQHEFYIISDEVYAALYFGHKKPVSALAFTEKTIVISSLSKSCSATGHRIGYLIAQESLVSLMKPVQQMMITCAPILSQCLAEEVFSEPRFLSLQRAYYEQKWAHTQQALEKHKIPYIAPQGGFYVCCPIVPKEVNAFDFCVKLLKEQDVVVVPGSAFGHVSDLWIRISFSSTDTLISTGIERIGRVIYER